MGIFQPELYFSIDASTLKVDTTLPFNVRLFLPLNRHIVTLANTGEPWPQRLADRIKERKVSELWLSKEDQEAYKKYIEAHRPAESLPVQPDHLDDAHDDMLKQLAAQAETASQAEHVHEVHGPSAFELASATAEPLKPKETPSQGAEAAGPATTPEQEAAEIEPEFAPDEIPVTSAETMKMVSGIFGNDPSAAEKAFEEAKGLAIDLIATAATPECLLAELLKKKDQGHSATVATFCVLFGIGLGHKKPEELRDLAIAGLLHDAGYTQIPSDIAWIPVNKLKPDTQAVMENHVELGMQLFGEIAYTSNTQTLGLVSDHHEKFDGTGFPKHTKGFRFTEMSQIVAFADTLDSFARGLLDGVKRSPGESLESILKGEMNPSFPHVFNPDVLKRLVAWFKDEKGFKTMITEAEKQAEATKDAL